ncbi:hypothetical protein GYB62_00215 [bacterium]|nr:hypothetical protein [bacterium]
MKLFDKQWAIALGTISVAGASAVAQAATVTVLDVPAQYPTYQESYASANPNDHELVYLGLNVPVNGSSVDVRLMSETGGPTRDVSLVLSAFADTQWSLTIDEGVNLVDIFVIATDGEAQTITGAVGITPTVSSASECGYSVPYNGGGCYTDRILGTNSPDPFNPLGTNWEGVNYLADLTDLSLTSFNGAYTTSGFDVVIEPIPVPATWLLFGSATLSLMAYRRRSSK